MILKNIFYLLILNTFLSGSCQDNSHAEKSTQEKTQIKTEDSLKSNIKLNTPVITKNYMMGKFEPRSHPSFSKVEKKYTTKDDIYLRTEAYQAYKKMQVAAVEDGIKLIIRSATRNFDYQKGIWERKWTGETKIENGSDASKKYPKAEDRALAILRYSSMPGTSRHHWGTDIDLNDFENSYFESGQGLKEYKWLQAHAADFGFCQTYTPKGNDRPDGYEEEKWHWSYTPISIPLLKYAQANLKDEDIQGFKGAQIAPIINVKKKYIFGINHNCKN